MSGVSTIDDINSGTNDGQTQTIAEIVERWADGWFDAETIVWDRQARTLTLDVQYVPDSPQGVAKRNWWYERSLRRVMIDRVRFDAVVRCDRSFSQEEATLWLSTVVVTGDQCVLFQACQGNLLIETERSTCAISTRDSGTEVVVTTICGIEYHSPRSR